MKIKDQIFPQSLRAQIVKEILQDADPQKIVLFGSTARNAPSRSSDLDIALFGVDQERARLIEDRLNEELDTLKDVDVISFESLKNPNLKERILKEGIVLYERVC